MDLAPERERERKTKNNAVEQYYRLDEKESIKATDSRTECRMIVHSVANLVVRKAKASQGE